MTLNFPKPAFSGQTYQIGESPYYIFNGNYWEIDKSYVVNGSSGTSGTSGIGSSGTAGTSGTSGTSGIGSSGTAGTSGTSGSNGSSGTSGTSGLLTLTGSTAGGLITYNGSGTNATVQSGVTYSGTTLTISGSLVITGSTNSVNNRLTNLENSVITGSVNYIQVLGNQRNGITSAGTSIVSGSITTTGNPVQIMVTGDANPTSGGGLWCSLQIYRDGNGIGNTVQLEAANNNENQAYCLNVIDTPVAGTYTYSLRVPTIVGTFQFGEVSGPLLTAIELSSNTTIRNTNNTFSGTNTFTGPLNVNNGVGLGGSSEGGEISLQYAQTTTLTGSNVVFDVYQDRVRIFESGGNNRGVHIDLSKSPGGVAGELMWKASGFVDAGTFVTLDNLKCTVTTSGQRGLSIGAVSTSFEADLSGWYGGQSIGTAGGAANNLGYNTTPSTSLFGWSFPAHGDTAQYHIRDKTNNRFYRVTMMIGNSYLNNFISIERLF
jgi:hypothetical protein